MNIESVKKVKQSKPFTVFDAVIVAVLVAAIGISIWLIFRTPAATVTITAPDFSHEYSLDGDATVALDCLTVHISGGEVWVTDSQCRDGTCEHTGKISRAGQSIVCLPNGVVITVNGKSDLHWEIGR